MLVRRAPTHIEVGADVSEQTETVEVVDRLPRVGELPCPHDDTNELDLVSPVAIGEPVMCTIEEQEGLVSLLQAEPQDSEGAFVEVDGRNLLRSELVLPRRQDVLRLGEAVPQGVRRRERQRRLRRGRRPDDEPLREIRVAGRIRLPRRGENERRVDGHPCLVEPFRDPERIAHSRQAARLHVLDEALQELHATRAGGSATLRPIGASRAASASATRTWPT